MTFLVVLKIFGKFAYLFVMSLLMGVAFGLIVALLLKKYNVSTYPQVCPTERCGLNHFIFASQNLLFRFQQFKNLWNCILKDSEANVIFFFVTMPIYLHNE